MTKRCRHETVIAGEWIDRWRFVGTMPKTRVLPSAWDRLVCVACRAWLSLGPSNDEPAAVKVEMRAAEMVQDIERIGATVLNRASFEAYGMNLFHNEPNETAPANAGEQAGYLAAAIVEHEEGCDGSGVVGWNADAHENVECRGCQKCVGHR